MDPLEKLRNTLVKDLMEKNYPYVRVDDDIRDAMSKLKGRGVVIIPVFDENKKFVGLINEQDLLKLIIDPRDISEQEILTEPLLGMSFFPKSIKDIMKRCHAFVSPDDTIRKAVLTMYRNKQQVLPVVENGKFVGILSQDNIFEALEEFRY